MTKTRKDNNVIDRTGAAYIKNKIELSRPIGSDADYDEN